MNDSLSNIINEFFEVNFIDNLPKKLAIALSGGCDSMALLFLLHDFCQRNNVELLAVTVDHQIRSNSFDEAQKVSKICQDSNISHQILQIPQSQIPTANIEANLRQARYELLYDFCQQHQIKYLFLGHHLGDIAENFIIRLFRGSGLDGLSSMAEINEYKDIYLARPLLNINKKELQDYLITKNIIWFEDETNKDEKFLRNKVRNFLNSLPDTDIIQGRIKRTADDISEVRDFYDDLMLQNAQQVLQIKEDSYLINIDKFKSLEPKIALKILALILMEVGKKPYKPRLIKLKNFYNHITQSNPIKQRNFYGCIVKQYNKNNLILCCEENNSVKRSKSFSKSKIRSFLES